MPKGALNFTKSVERTKAKQTARVDYPKIDYFGIQDGQKARVRFLEQGTDLTWGVCHRIQVPGGQFPQDVICLDQEDEGTPCPACQSDKELIRRRSTKGFLNVIWRGNEDLFELNETMKKEAAERGEKFTPYTLAPVYKRNQYGSPEKQNGKKVITGFEDAVFLWKCSKTIFQTLLSKDAKYKGLMSRDFEISREGAGLEDTKYFIEPADVDAGPQPITVADEVIMEKKYNLEVLTTAPTYAEMAAMLTGESDANESFPDNSIQPNTDDVFKGKPVIRSSAFTS